MLGWRRCSLYGKDFFADTAPILELKHVVQQQSNGETSSSAENFQAHRLPTSRNPDEGDNKDASPSEDGHGHAWEAAGPRTISQAAAASRRISAQRAKAKILTTKGLARLGSEYSWVLSSCKR
jgi:hypothetical protein